MSHLPFIYLWTSLTCWLSLALFSQHSTLTYLIFLLTSSSHIVDRLLYYTESIYSQFSKSKHFKRPGLRCMDSYELLILRNCRMLLLIQNIALTSTWIKSSVFWTEYQWPWSRNMNSGCPICHVHGGCGYMNLLGSRATENHKSKNFSNPLTGKSNKLVKFLLKALDGN